MCGFAGFIGSKTSPGDREAILTRMGAQLARRGPDEERHHLDDALSLVFRRLSIIDVEGGSQPIWNEDNTLLVAVNGEIYNHIELRGRLKSGHQFRTQSDSEIILHLYEDYGPDALSLLNGMFALAIWDVQNKQLFLARDRLGIKPLFYAQKNGTLLFGSELKAILCHPDSPRDFAWDLEAPLSSHVRDIEVLKGGHYLTFTVGENPRVKQYWHLEAQFNSRCERDENGYVEQFLDLLHDSVKKRLMSDVPLGLFLSGGLDSSCIAASAAMQGSKLHCFNFVQDTVEKSGDAASAQALAEHFALPLHRVHFELGPYTKRGELGLKTLEYMVWAIERPFSSAEFLFKHELHRYAKTLFPDLKVILLGQGIDEFSGGYTSPYHDPRANWDDYARRKARDLIHPKLIDLVNPEYCPTPATPTHGFYHDMMLRYLLNLQSYNLWHEDRTASSQGIESRVPFLDHRIVELLASVPGELHPTLFWDKTIVRRAASQILPERLAHRHKVAFYVDAKGHDIGALSSELLPLMFPPFCEKYLTQPEAIFSRTALQDVYDATQWGERDPKETMPLLFESMVIEVFCSFCRNPDLGFSTGRMLPPSPLVQGGYSREAGR